MDNNIFCLWNGKESIKIVRWKIREGSQISNGQLILQYQLVDSDDKEIKRLKSTKIGVAEKKLFKDGEIIKGGSPVLKLSECSHTTVIKDMCADCGADLRQNENGNVSEASVPMIHSVPELKVTQKLAQKLGKADTERLLEDRKLVLLVDLDQTLIHTTNDNVPNNLKDIYHFQLYGPSSPWYHTRLRPGTKQFLKNMAPFFELHICTFGARNYAHTIAMFLDQDGKYFSHRILSRDECFNATSKTDNLKALFPCGDSMVCIIDDREDVWNMASNLIQVKPYHFFQHTGDINAPPGMSKNELDGKGLDFKDLSSQKDKKVVVDDKEEEIDEEKTVDVEKLKIDEPKTEDEEVVVAPVTPGTSKVVEKKSKEDDLIEIEDPDDYLLYLEQILKKIHENFYKIYDSDKSISDLKALVPKIRSEVLIGKNLVFSGLVPNHMKLEQSRAYLIAKSLGAQVSQSLTKDTTHLVALTPGTVKVTTARKQTGIKIVAPAWLWSCAERWECVDERIFPLDSSKGKTMRQPPLHCHSPEHSTNYNNRTEHDTPMDTELKFIDTINPLMSFSNAELAEMNEEIENSESDSSDDSDEEPVDIENPPLTKVLRKRKRAEKDEVNLNFFSRPENEKIKFDLEQEESKQGDFSSSEDEMPSAKFRRGEDLPSDLDMGSNGASEGSNDPIDEEDNGDWTIMGAALEREFLGLDQ